MGKKKESWLDPWKEPYWPHAHALREKLKSKDQDVRLQALREHLPVMIEIRNEIASLDLPEPAVGLIPLIWNKFTGVSEGQRLEIERDAFLKVSGESITGFQRELRKLENTRR